MNVFQKTEEVKPTAEIDLASIEPRYYQWEAYQATKAQIKASRAPFFIDASVGSGKTIMIGMVVKRAQSVGMRCLVLARNGRLAQQGSDMLWRMKASHSIFSASLNKKSLHFPDIVGTEGTVANALFDEMRDHVFDLLLIDECHHVNCADAITEASTSYGKIIKELYRRNEKLRVIGYTGSAYRGIESIKGDFWAKCVYSINTHRCISEGFLVPIQYGVQDEQGYDFSEFKASGDLGTQDYTAKELQAMWQKVKKNPTKTHEIIAEVVKLASSRGGVLITCSSKKHCQQAAELLPKGSYGIITDETPQKQRDKYLDGAEAGTIKYILQVDCLTTGVNVPRWDTLVIMRKIGSLTLITQLIGRILRSPDGDYQKTEGLILDYSGTMDELGELFDDPILQDAQAKKAINSNDYITCPACQTHNSKFARRCIGPSASEKDGRCGYFWSFVECPKCKTKNDRAARECRECEHILIDPNKSLIKKHYKEDDYKAVEKMDMRLTRNGAGVVIDYYLEADEKATEVYYPDPKSPQAWQIWKSRFVFKHVRDKGWVARALKITSAASVIANKAIFDVPTHITHRINDKGKSVITKRRFRSGFTAE